MKCDFGAKLHAMQHVIVALLGLKVVHFAHFGDKKHLLNIFLFSKLRMRG